MMSWFIIWIISWIISWIIIWIISRDICWDLCHFENAYKTGDGHSLCVGFTVNASGCALKRSTQGLVQSASAVSGLNLEASQPLALAYPSTAPPLSSHPASRPSLQVQGGQCQSALASDVTANAAEDTLGNAPWSHTTNPMMTGRCWTQPHALDAAPAPTVPLPCTAVSGFNWTQLSSKRGSNFDNGMIKRLDAADVRSRTGM